MISNRERHRWLGQRIHAKQIGKAAQQSPLALVVFLENVGHIHGLSLPPWVMALIDFVTEEYAKILLRLYGAHRRYDRVIVLEDEQATAPHLSRTLLETSRTHRIDLLLLVHGQVGSLVGYQGREHVDLDDLAVLRDIYRGDPQALRLRMVYGVNCYGAMLAPIWIDLGAQIANGAIGVNWLPEPSLSVFLWNWLNGRSYHTAVRRSFRSALRWGRRVWPRDAAGCEHAHIQGSYQIVYGVRDISINS